MVSAPKAAAEPKRPLLPGWQPSSTTVHAGATQAEPELCFSLMMVGARSDAKGDVCVTLSFSCCPDSCQCLPVGECIGEGSSQVPNRAEMDGSRVEIKWQVHYISGKLVNLRVMVWIEGFGLIANHSPNCFSKMVHQFILLLKVYEGVFRPILNHFQILDITKTFSIFANLIDEYKMWLSFHSNR